MEALESEKMSIAFGSWAGIIQTQPEYGNISQELRWWPWRVQKYLIHRRRGYTTYNCARAFPVRVSGEGVYVDGSSNNIRKQLQLHKTQQQLTQYHSVSYIRTRAQLRITSCCTPGIRIFVGSRMATTFPLGTEYLHIITRQSFCGKYYTVSICIQLLQRISYTIYTLHTYLHNTYQYQYVQICNVFDMYTLYCQRRVGSLE